MRAKSYEWTHENQVIVQPRLLLNIDTVGYNLEATGCMSERMKIWREGDGGHGGGKQGAQTSARFVIFFDVSRWLCIDVAVLQISPSAEFFPGPNPLSDPTSESFRPILSELLLTTRNPHQVRELWLTTDTLVLLH
jgi:hypothetical protein